MLAQWAALSPYALVPQHLAELRQFKGLAFDWGEQDEFKHILVTCRMLDTELSASGIAHPAEGYEGTHGSGVMGPNGRMYQKMLPFFNRLLKFE